jgi:hypothetical protein
MKMREKSLSNSQKGLSVLLCFILSSCQVFNQQFSENKELSKDQCTVLPKEFMANHDRTVKYFVPSQWQAEKPKQSLYALPDQS